MQIQKAFFGEQDKAPITCTQCGVAREVSSSEITNIFRPVRVKCACGAVFLVIFEKRRNYRKTVHLQGYYRPGSGKLKEECEMIVENISTTGVGFRTLEANSIQAGDVIQLRFALRNPRNTVIRARGIVRMIQGKYVGTEFYNLEENIRKEIGFYLLP